MQVFEGGWWEMNLVYDEAHKQFIELKKTNKLTVCGLKSM